MRSGTGTVRVWQWWQWPVLAKLIATLLIPTAIAVTAGALLIIDEAARSPEYLRAHDVAELQAELTDLRAELGAERVASVRSLAGDVSVTLPAVQERQAATDRATDRVDAAAALVPTLDRRATGYTAALTRLDNLGAVRREVLDATGDADEALAAYNTVAALLLDLDDALAREIADPELAPIASTLQALGVLAEQISRQHATLALAIVRNGLDPAAAASIRDAQLRADLALEDVHATFGASPDIPGVLLAGPEIGDRDELLRLALGRSAAEAPLSIDPQDWDRRTAAMRDLIDGAAGEQQQIIAARSLALSDSTRSSAGWEAVILLFALAAGVVVGVLVARSMFIPLRRLRRAALDIAGRRLPRLIGELATGTPRTVAVEPVPVYLREEIGQVARAFDQVHEQAVRLATEQARLRGNVNEIFVNLARRSQGLVQRQLALIDQLESDEADPETLAQLFRLDHLATRMRRNSDSLLVIAGADCTQRGRRPVPLDDVLRAAMSEVEQYQRLMLRPAPPVLLLGQATADLTHLLAELMDNATAFSAPDTQVMVTSHYASETGTVTINVHDHGVAMTATDATEANRQLGTTMAELDGAAARRMGLFVVGRLAARHGVRVQLYPHGDRGLTASVVLPPRLARPAAQLPHPAATNGASSGARPTAPPTAPPMPGDHAVGPLPGPRTTDRRGHPRLPEPAHQGGTRAGLPRRQPAAHPQPDLDRTSGTAAGRDADWTRWRLASHQGVRNGPVRSGNSEAPR